MNLEIALNSSSPHCCDSTCLWEEKGSEYLVSNQERSLFAVSQQISAGRSSADRRDREHWSRLGSSGLMSSKHHIFSNSEMPDRVISVAKGCLGSVIAEFFLSII